MKTKVISSVENTKTISIWFEGFWKDFHAENNFITNLLITKYSVVLDRKNPQFLFYSVFNNKHLKYQCVKIFFSGENISPDFNVCDYAIGFEDIQFGIRYLSYPLWLLYLPYYCDTNDIGECSYKIKKRTNKKKHFCSFVYSNGKAEKIRELFFLKLSEYKQVDSGGKLFNNVGGPVEDKIDFESKHKFVIAFENVSQCGYTTEKILSAFASGAIPIYWGDPEITHIFNKDAFINCNNHTISEMVQMVIEIDQDEEKYYRMNNAPIFVDDDYAIKKKDELKNFLSQIVDGVSQNAIKNSRLYWKKKYIRRIKLGAYVSDAFEGIWSLLHR